MVGVTFGTWVGWEGGIIFCFEIKNGRVMMMLVVSGVVGLFW